MASGDVIVRTTDGFTVHELTTNDSTNSPGAERNLSLELTAAASVDLPSTSPAYTDASVTLSIEETPSITEDTSVLVIRVGWNGTELPELFSASKYDIAIIEH